ncbi:DNA-binding response regulator [Paucibacter sp. KBW04]|uniref:response regulator transcription factor n=1 Tax=Paucibacter sp. KBW04 TaxID=2153361 RepID=UPI000F57FA5F|nr:response regulator transcription factor [Paucibacter sp. KBW04]RQO61142.1 DNA-binding response regulator [Paucibacter sp. KBW04]
MKVCIVEDDLALGRSLQSALQDAGHEVVWVRRLIDARHWLREDSFDALLLDLSLPDGDGLNALRHWRAEGLRLPILVITARDSIEDRLTGLDLGADDYVLKPFITAELLARLRAVARRAGRWSEDAGSNRWTCKDLLLDDARMTLSRKGQQIHLSKTEFALMRTLMRYAERVLTRSELEARALPHSEGQALDVHIFNLRKKIGEGYVRTVRGIGYTLESE